MVHKTLSFDQFEILDAIRELHVGGNFKVDATFGNGSFYRDESEWPTHRFDLDDQLPNCDTADSRDLPLIEGSVDSLVFDPPFLTYVRQGREGNGKMVMARRFGGYWRYDELEDHYKKSLVEFNRVMARKGVLVVKCQDIVHNHRLHDTHCRVISWAQDAGFRLKDLFILGATHRLPCKTNFKQRHARIFHSYFLVFIKIKDLEVTQ